MRARGRWGSPSNFQHHKAAFTESGKPTSAPLMKTELSPFISSSSLYFFSSSSLSYVHSFSFSPKSLSSEDKTGNYTWSENNLISTQLAFPNSIHEIALWSTKHCVSSLRAIFRFREYIYIVFFFSFFEFICATGKYVHCIVLRGVQISSFKRYCFVFVKRLFGSVLWYLVPFFVVSYFFCLFADLIAPHSFFYCVHHNDYHYQSLFLPSILFFLLLLLL